MARDVGRALDVPLAEVDAAVGAIMADVAAEYGVRIEVSDVQRAPAAPPTPLASVP